MRIYGRTDASPLFDMPLSNSKLACISRTSSGLGMETFRGTVKDEENVSVMSGKSSKNKITNIFAVHYLFR